MIKIENLNIINDRDKEEILDTFFYKKYNFN